jgi:hypothetical protein
MKRKDAEEKLGIKVREISEHTTVVERRGHAHPITSTERDLWDFIQELCEDD